MEITYYYQTVNRPAAASMKMQKSAVFRGAAASWTGYPSGRTRSLFPALPCPALTLPQ